MKPQPVKIFPNGKVMQYQSRFSLLTKTSRDALRYVVIFSVKKLNAFLSSDFKIKKWSNIDLTTLKKEIKFLFEYRFCGFFDFDGIMQPIGGFSILPLKMKEAILKNNINCILGKKVNTIFAKDSNVIINVGGKEFFSSKVYISESTDTKLINFQVKSKKIHNFKVYPHILVYVSRLKSKFFPQYIQVRNDNNFRRITLLKNHYCDSREGLFLIQTRSQMRSDPSHKDRIKSLLLRLKLIDNEVDVKVKDYFNDYYLGSSKESALAPGKLNDSIVCLETIGDISKIIALHSKD
jgi:hypothetical protein